MAETFRFSLVSPERLLLSEEVEQVVAPGSEGQFTVLPQHAPLITSLQPGIVEIRVRAGDERRIMVFGGFAEVGEEGFTILAEQAIQAGEASADAIDDEIRRAEADAEIARDEDSKLKARTKADQLRMLKAAVAA